MAASTPFALLKAHQSAGAATASQSSGEPARETSSMAGASVTKAPSPSSSATRSLACARELGHGHAATREGAGSNQASSPASAATRPTTVTSGGRQARRRHLLGDAGEGARQTR